MKKLLTPIVAALALLFPFNAQASTLVPLWANVHHDGAGRPTSAQLSSFTAAAGWAAQFVPGPVWWYYVKGTRTPEKNLPESWYLHVNGVRVRDRAHLSLFVMNPENAGWRLHVASICPGRCFLDGSGTAAIDRSTPSIHGSWTAQRWVNAVAGEIRVMVAHGKVVLPNSALYPWVVREYNAAAGRVSTEGFIGLASLPLLANGNTWVFAKGRVGECGHLLAVYLIGAGLGDHFSCFVLGTEPWVVPSRLIGPSVGSPLGPAVRIIGGYRRYFAHAKVWAYTDGTYKIVRM